ncbi:hypothetical protein MUK42_35967 [Musa troglodytarum]|uniref:Uncharacterized protein n=1 Tax=Musa troglodytarum TaxID=320322 RepID=A0A9E7GB44_9LILI|nr:hypothetical protein MUK42_35967 [Musa troglodytarum]
MGNRQRIGSRTIRLSHELRPGGARWFPPASPRTRSGTRCRPRFLVPLFSMIPGRIGFKGI